MSLHLPGGCTLCSVSIPFVNNPQTIICPLVIFIDSRYGRHYFRILERARCAQSHHPIETVHNWMARTMPYIRRLSPLFDSACLCTDRISRQFYLVDEY